MEETNNIATMELLLANQQMDVNSTNNAGNTALHIAASKDNVELVKLLLAHPRFNSANHLNDEGRSAAMVAAEGQKGNALRELVAHQSVDLDILDRNGRSLNQIAAWFVGYDDTA